MSDQTTATKVKFFDKGWVKNGLISFYVAILVGVSLFPNGLNSTHFGVMLLESPERLSEVFGYSDAGSYLKASMELEALNYLTANQHWVINLWPPGMVWLDAALLRLFGSSFALSLAILSGLIWVTVASVFAIKIRTNFGQPLAYLSVTFLLMSSPLQIWIFDAGLFYAEGFSIAAFLGGLVLLIRGSLRNVKESLISHGISAGVMFGLAAYFRTTFSTLETLLLLGVIGLALLAILQRLINGVTATLRQLNNQLVLLTATWLAMFTLMEPWLQFTTSAIRGERAWSVVGGNFLRGAWVNRSTSPDFLKSGGVGWACEMDPKFCQKLIDQEKNVGAPYDITDLALKTIQTIVAHPFEYLTDRTHYLLAGWFSSEQSMGTLSLVSGFILMSAFFITISQLVKSVRAGNFASLFVILACFLIIAPMMIGHVEPRYFIPLKLLFFILPWVSVKHPSFDSRDPLVAPSRSNTLP